MTPKTPEQKARRREWEQEYRQRPEVKAKARQRARGKTWQQYKNRRDANPDLYRAKEQAYQRKYRSKPKSKRVMLDCELRRQYGISLEQYDAMLEAQGHVCRLCKQPTTERRLDVDHCHTTGVVRGLLCNLCNTGIGKFRDRPDLLRLAAEYLEGTQQATRESA